MLGDINPKELRLEVDSGVVYPGLDHTVNVKITQYDGRAYRPVDLSAVTRVVLIMPDVTPRIVFDSSYLPEAIVWSGNTLSVDLSVYAVPCSVHNCHVVMFDTQHPRGQVIVDGVDSELTLDFRDILTAGTLPMPIGDTTTMSRTAGEPISALKVVYELGGTVYLLDAADAAHVDLLLGVAITAADTGGQLVVQRAGVIDDSSWTWAPGRVWLGASGALTQVAPAAGQDVLIGSAASATRLILNITDSIDLGV